MDHTALYLTLAADGQAPIAQCSTPYSLKDQAFPGDTIPATSKPPFQLIDAIVQYLR